MNYFKTIAQKDLTAIGLTIILNTVTAHPTYSGIIKGIEMTTKMNRMAFARTCALFGTDEAYSLARDVYKVSSTQLELWLARNDAVVLAQLAARIQTARGVA